MTPPSGEFPMANRRDVPEGLCAWAQPSNADGTYALDRAGQPKVRRVLLRSIDATTPTRPPNLLTDAEWTWATSGTHRWNSAISQFGDRAHTIVTSLARAGCIAIEHDFRHGSLQQPPKGWIPHPDLQAHHAERQQHRRQQRSSLATEADRLRKILSPEWPGVASSLAVADHDPRLEWIIWAAGDLAAGVSHDSVRAFAQVHARNTKARDDLPQLLRAAGWEAQALTLLGINRSPYLGLGGPLRTRIGHHVLDFTGWPGPHDMRLVPGIEITLETRTGASTLLIIENRQAAEAICDAYPDLPVIWCHGQPSGVALDLIATAAQGVTTVLICPDSDLGGVRIAGRVYDRLPPDAARHIIDAGAEDHPQGPTFGPTTRAHLQQAADRNDAVGDFARACLARGYAVEQEAALRAAVRRALSDEVLGGSRGTSPLGERAHADDGATAGHRT